MRPIAILPILITLLASAPVSAASPDLIVHEWGTFTSFQDSIGATIAGINVDDEPVPKFVHRLHEGPVFTTRSMPALWSQGAPRCHRDVTLRLETPVLYFYPQPTSQATHSKSARRFVGGWLTEFYPFAETSNSGFPGELERDTEGRAALERFAARRETLPACLRPPSACGSRHARCLPRSSRRAVTRKRRNIFFIAESGRIDAPLVVRGQGRHATISSRYAS